MMKINITLEERKALIEEIHANAVAKGFWSEDHSEEHYLMLAITELSEAVEADRKGRRAYRSEYEDILRQCPSAGGPALFEQLIKDTVEDELADALIRLYDICGAIDYKQNEEYIAACKENALLEYEECYSDELTAQILRCITSITRDDIASAIAKIEAVAEYNGIDLYWYVRDKMKYNATRPALHGKKY